MERIKTLTVSVEAEASVAKFALITLRRGACATSVIFPTHRRDNNLIADKIYQQKSC